MFGPSQGLLIWRLGNETPTQKVFGRLTRNNHAGNNWYIYVHLPWKPTIHVGEFIPIPWILWVFKRTTKHTKQLAMIFKPLMLLRLLLCSSLTNLDLLVRCLEKVTKKSSPKWWFNGHLPWYNVKHHLKQIQDTTTAKILWISQDIPLLKNSLAG